MRHQNMLRQRLTLVSAMTPVMAPVVALAMAAVLGGALAESLAAADVPVNAWVKVESAGALGRRTDVPLVYWPRGKRFMVLGGRTSWASYRKVPRPYDVLALDTASGRWENWFAPGASWGPRFGPCTAPPWKDELWHFKDVEGNVRPNWTVYGTFSMGRTYDYDPAARRFVFLADGRTFSYDPAARRWQDLAPPTDPQRALGGVLLWSAMCYDAAIKRFVLFGGGNVQSPRGDPGTWTYDPQQNQWAPSDVGEQPPQRANSAMAYDPVNQRVVLFGGDHLDKLLADTWTFDGTKWHNQQPKGSPPPCAGHALLWLPKARKVLLLGGYVYDSGVGYGGNFYKRQPMRAWVYDAAANTWSLVKQFGPAGKQAPADPAGWFLSAAVDEDDTLVVVDQQRQTWMCRLDASQIVGEGTDILAAAPGAVERRTGPYDPAWYTSDVPATDAAKVADELAHLPANTWVRRPTPKLPRPNMDWGSAVFDPAHDLILRFSGGHSAYSGTAPLVYDVKTDRYTIPFVPEMPLEFVRSNDQVHGEWSFGGNPWMSGHTYKTTGYDPHLKCLVYAAHGYTYFFDAPSGKWSRAPKRSPFRPNMYVVTLATTPKGVVAWAQTLKDSTVTALWRLDESSRTWQAMPLEGRLPACGPDRHGMAYDAKRDRLLCFSAVGDHKGDVSAYELSSGRAKWLDPAGKAGAAASSRETIYLPQLDAVLIAAHVNGPDGEARWPLYDCQRNAWFAAALGGDDPVGKRDFNNSMGLMFDAGRNLVWAVGQNSEVYVLRIDPATVKRSPM